MIKTTDSDKLKYVVTVLRSLCSSHKNPVLIVEILKNYLEVEGVNLNVEQFGFKSVEEFLRSTNEFKFESKNGEVYISSKHKEESKHIDLLVSRQKSGKKRNTTSFRHPNKSDNSWNTSTFSTNVYQKFRSNLRSQNSYNRQSSYSSRTSTGDTNNNRYPNRNGYNSSKQSQKNSGSEHNSHYHPKSGGGGKKSENQKPFERRLAESSKQSSSPPVPRAILGQNNNKTLTSTTNASKQPVNSTQKEQLNHTRNSYSRISNLKPTMPPSNPIRTVHTSSEPQQRSTTNKTRITPKTSVQDRFKLAVMQCSTTKKSLEKLNNDDVEESWPLNNENNETAQISEPVIFEFNLNSNPITALEEYCLFRNFPLPKYELLCSKYCKEFHCRVVVNGSAYSTYPDGYDTDDASRKACAKKAIQQIQAIEQRNQLPVCEDSDYELMTKICEELVNHPSGIFTKNLPECFVKSYKQILPENWWIRVKPFDKFITESFAENSILFLKPPIPTGSDDNCKMISNSLGQIDLPWKSKYWNLYITNCISTVNISARLLNENNELFEKLLTDIELHMMSHKSRPVSIELDQIYLVFIVDSWHRVRVDKIEPISESCECFFIDFGDKDSIQCDQLYTCDAEFLKLSGQAIPFSLFGLEDFAENPVTKPHLEKMLLEKSLVGEILTSQQAFELESVNSKNHPIHIQCVLYDTSSNDDVNLNPLLLNNFCNDTRIPEIKSSITNIIITFVNNDGDIYLQVAKRELTYVKKLIQQLVESKFKREHHAVSIDDINDTSLYLIHDIEDNRWYRGKLASKEVSKASSVVRIFYVDVGINKNIDIMNIFQLESLSAALARFPYQALRVKLHNLPLINETIVSRIRGLLPAGLTAVAKLIKTDSIPHVAIYRRFDSVTSLCNVNEIIRVEHEMEQSFEILDDEFLNNESTLPDVITSPLSKLAISSKSLHELPTIKPFKVITSDQHFFDVVVASSTNPSSFIVQPYSDSPKLIQLIEELQIHYANNNKIVPIESVKPGEAYAAMDPKGYYHRVIILGKFNHLMVHVSYCDLGQISIINMQNLKELPLKFRSLPMQGIPAKLADIKSNDREWTVDDCKRFHGLTTGNKFVSVVKKIKHSDNIYKNSSLELELVDVSTDEDLLISQILVLENRAKNI